MKPFNDIEGNNRELAAFMENNQEEFDPDNADDLFAEIKRIHSETSSS